jgi:hypothetical protein
MGNCIKSKQSIIPITTSNVQKASTEESKTTGKFQTVRKASVAKMSPQVIQVQSAKVTSKKPPTHLHKLRQQLSSSAVYKGGTNTITSNNTVNKSRNSNNTTKTTNTTHTTNTTNTTHTTNVIAENSNKSSF